MDLGKPSLAARMFLRIPRSSGMTITQLLKSPAKGIRLISGAFELNRIFLVSGLVVSDRLGSMFLFLDLLDDLSASGSCSIVSRFFDRSHGCLFFAKYVSSDLSSGKRCSLTS